MHLKIKEIFKTEIPKTCYMFCIFNSSPLNQLTVCLFFQEIGVIDSLWLIFKD